MKKSIIRFLLAILNSRMLNSTPCRYEFVGNIDAFSRENLESEVAQKPDITVKEVLESAALFKTCSLYPGGLSVIEDGRVREATAWDMRDLRNLGGER